MEKTSEGTTQDIEANFHALLNPCSIACATATETWLEEGVAYEFALNFRLSLAMLYISSLLSELPYWAYRNPSVFSELLKHEDCENEQVKHLTSVFREKLNVVILAFERRYSLKLIDLANMVLELPPKMKNSISLLIFIYSTFYNC